MGTYAQLLTADRLAGLSAAQRDIVRVLTVDELRPLEALLLRAMSVQEEPLPLVDGWHAPYTPLPGPSL